jgi:non-heme chloroperoxidase
MRRFLLCLFVCLPCLASARTRLAVTDHFFLTSDGVRLHYTDSGPAGAQTIVFIPGWTMPGWIFGQQIRAFSGAYRVIAFDPRGQGISDIAISGYNQDRRGQDIADLLAQLGPRPVVLAGWSLGVLDDNSVGEDPAPLPEKLPPHRGPVLSHAAYMQSFVAGMFRTPQPAAYLRRLTEAALRTPAPYAAALLRYPVPRSYWRDAIFSTNKPVLYVVRPGLSGQADNLARDRPNTSTAIYTGAGHALFVDDAARFDALMRHFLATKVWP